MHVFKEYSNKNRILIEFLGDVQGQGGKFANYTGITMKPERVFIIREGIYSRAVCFFLKFLKFLILFSILSNSNVQVF
jgi:hypothetical protein